jgi:peptidoglycan/xylan/chitin deacetylase (PgdA/CDA1 family)
VNRSLAFASLGSAAVATQWAPAAAAVFPSVARIFGVPTRLPSTCGDLLLTFDDGPHPQGTPAVLAALDRAGIKSVFFVCGQQAESRPDLVREVAAAGHELGVHGYMHRTRYQWTRRALSDDIRRAVDALGRTAGVAPRLYRPPHGAFTVTGLRLIRTLGLEPLLWSKWGRDWRRGATRFTIAEAATKGLHEGDVILLHDSDRYGAHGSWRATAAAVPLIVERAIATGLGFVSGSRCVHTGSVGSRSI